MYKKSLAIMALAFSASASFATFTPVTDNSQLQDDHIDWGTAFGAEFTQVTSGSFGLTTGGRLFQVWSDDDFGNNDFGGLERRDEDSGWAGEFQPGEHLLWHQASYTNDFTQHSVLRIDILSGDVVGIGVQSQSNAGGNFTTYAGYWNPYPANLIGFSSNTGVNNIGSHNGSAYTGGYTDDGTKIGQMFVLSSMDDGSDNFGFAVGTVDLKVVPEPTSMLALGLGVAAMVRRRRKSA